MSDERIERFLTHLAERGCSTNTIAAYRSDLSQLDRHISGHAHGVVPVPWHLVTPATLRRFVAVCATNGQAPATVARRVGAVRAFVRWLHAEGAIGTDPARDLRATPVVKAPPAVLTPEEVARLVAQPRRRRLTGYSAAGDAPADLRDDAMLRLLAATGLRVSELIGLDIADVDLASGEVRCRSATERERYVPLDEATCRALGVYLQDARPLQIRDDDAPALFVNCHGVRPTRAGVWLIVKGHARAAGLPTIMPRTLRHSFAVRLLSDGARARDVQELLGHARIETTTRMYTAAVVARRRTRTGAA